MFARSISILLLAAVCLASLAETNAQSTASLVWPQAKTAPPDMITVADARPQPAVPVPARGLSRADRKRLEPDDADKARFRELFEKEKSGIIKLLNVSCVGDGPLVVRVGDCGDSIPGHGSDYSFRVGRHVFPAIADLKLDGNRLIVGSVMTQGLIVSIGKVDIRSVDLSGNAIKFLSGFVPAVDSNGAQQQTLLLNKGIWKDGLLYRATVPVVEDETYLMRTIAYRTRDDGGDKRVDLVIAFTIVRQDAGGNVTLIWRRLKETPSPKITTLE